MFSHPPSALFPHAQYALPAYSLPNPPRLTSFPFCFPLPIKNFQISLPCIVLLTVFLRFASCLQLSQAQAQEEEPAPQDLREVQDPSSSKRQRIATPDLFCMQNKMPTTTKSSLTMSLLRIYAVMPVSCSCYYVCEVLSVQSDSSSADVIRLYK